ncbi:MAG: hypothetical protein U5L11_02055 [Arhodomonas sp.]|nr:hypothetical protein [Arhodomonas sp.]
MISALLADALRRAAAEPETTAITARLTLITAEARCYLSAAAADVV